MKKSGTEPKLIDVKSGTELEANKAKSGTELTDSKAKSGTELEDGPHRKATAAGIRFNRCFSTNYILEFLLLLRVFVQSSQKYNILNDCFTCNHRG